MSRLRVYITATALPHRHRVTLCASSESCSPKHVLFRICLCCCCSACSASPDEHTDDHLLLSLPLPFSSQHSAVSLSRGISLAHQTPYLWEFASDLSSPRPLHSSHIGLLALLDLSGHMLLGGLWLASCLLSFLQRVPCHILLFPSPFNILSLFPVSPLFPQHSPLPMYCSFLYSTYVFARLAFPCRQRWLSANIPTILMHSKNFSCS